MKNEAVAKRLDAFVAGMASSTESLEKHGLGGGARIVEGWGGIVDKFGFEQLSASQGVGKLERDQIVRLPNETTGELEDVVVAKAGEFGVAFNLFLKDGRTIAVSALRQSAKSTFDMGASGILKAVEMNQQQWAGLIGKTIKVTKRGEDADITLTRTAANGNPISRKANYFTFSVEG